MKSLKIICLFVLVNVFTFHSFAQKSTDEDLANQYFSDKEYDKAVIYFEKLHNKNDNPLFYNRLLNCYIELQEFKNAEKLVKRQIKNNPFEVAYNADLAHVYKVEGKENEARQTAEKTIKELIPNQQLVQELAMAFLRYQELDDAKETYLQGRKILKETYPFNFELAQIYNLQGKTEAMLNEYLEALVFQESFIQSVQNALQTVLYPDEDGSKKSLLKTLLLKYIQKYPDKKVFSEMLIWLYIQEENFNGAFIQAKALDKRFKEYGQRLTALAELCLENKDYETAIKCYQYVIEKGPDNFYYISAKMELVNVYNQKIVNEKNYTEQDLQQLENTYLSTLSELGRTATTSPLLRGLARLYAFYLHQPQKAIDMLTEAKEMGGMKPQDIAQIKIDLADVYLFVDEIWEASLLYSQVEKEFKYDQLGETAKFKNAKISFYTGDFAWSKAQLDVLKASTSKLIANDAMQLSILITDNIGIDTTQAPLLIYAKADLLAYQNKQTEAMKLLDSLAATFPIHTINDDILYKKYEINYHMKNNAAAIENLQKIIDNYAYDILADDAIYHLALIYDYEQNDKEKAKELYKKLLFEHQDSVYGVDARKRYRELQTGVNIININEDKLEFEAN